MSAFFGESLPSSKYNDEGRAASNYGLARISLLSPVSEQK
jgi:hypothetical protein